MNSNLKPFLRSKLDILFVALNPPTESNENGHYFSGKNSRFFHLLYKSGLITQPVDKSIADEVVFGSTNVNYKNCAFGVMDLVQDLVETNSSKVHPKLKNVESLLLRIRGIKPRFVCIIHAKVRDALNKHPDITWKLDYGYCGAVLQDSESKFVVNYFPNGNNIPDELKIKIFSDLRDSL